MGAKAGEVWSETAGEPGAPLVVLVHGSMDRSAGLLRLSRRLDDDHRVLRYDRRGYGRSLGVGPPWTVAANVDDLVALVERTEPGGPVVVFGHSFGGNVALASSARRPDLVDAVVVYETPLSWFDWWPGNSAGGAAVATPDPGDAAEVFMRRLVGDAAWERLSPVKQAARRAEGVAMVDELADLRRCPPWTSDEIGVPVLALHGEHGRPHHRTAMGGLAELLTDCRVEEIPAAGHAGPHTHPDAVADVVRAFTSSLGY